MSGTPPPSQEPLSQEPPSRESGTILTKVRNWVGSSQEPPVPFHSVREIELESETKAQGKSKRGDLRRNSSKGKAEMR